MKDGLCRSLVRIRLDFRLVGLTRCLGRRLKRHSTVASLTVSRSTSPGHYLRLLDWLLAVDEEPIVLELSFAFNRYLYAIGYSHALNADATQAAAT